MIGLRQGSLAVALLWANPAMAAQGLAIEHDAPGCLVAGKFPRLEACVANPSQVARGRVHFRAEGGRHWYHVELKAGDRCFAAVLPKPRMSAKKVNYYIEVADPSFAVARTQEYAPVVVSREGDCRKDLKVAVALSTASVVISAAVGAPAIPAGFSAAGIVAAGATGAAAGAGAGAGVGAGASGTGGGLSGTSIGLIAGGVAAAAGVAVVVARGGDAADPASIDDDGDGFSEAQGDCNDADPVIRPGGGFELSADFPWTGAVSCTPPVRPYNFTIRNNSCSPLSFNLTGTRRRRDAFSDTTDATPARSGTVPAGTTQTVSLQFGTLTSPNPPAFRCCGRSGIGVPCSQVFTSGSTVVEETAFTLVTDQGNRTASNTFTFDESQCPACSGP